MSPQPKTAAEAFGPEIADALARWAIDALVVPPVSIATGSTRIPSSLIREGREILDRAGIDWRRFHRERERRLRAARDRVHYPERRPT